MALISRDNGAQNIVLRCWLPDSSSTSGAGKTGLTNASPGLKIAAICDNEGTTTVYTAAGSTIDTITTLGTYAAPASGHCGFKELDATNHPGMYEIQIANSRFAVSSASYVIVTVQAGASNVPPVNFLVEMDAQVDVVAYAGVTGTASSGIPAVNLTQVEGVSTRAHKLGLEMDGRVTGTVTNTTFSPTTTSFECSDITDSASFPVYINRGFLVTAGSVIKGIGTILGDIVGTSGRRFTTTAMQQALASGDTIIIC